MNDLQKRIQEEYRVKLSEEGTPSWDAVKHIKKRTCLEVYWATNGNVTKTCSAARISRHTFYKWRNEDPKFRGYLIEQEEQLCDKLEGELLDRALNKNNDTALIFALKNIHPRYKQQKETLAVQNGDVKFVVSRG